MTRKAQRLKRQRESDELPASTDGNGATAAAPQPPPAKKSKTSQKPARKRAHEKAAARGRPNARFSRSNALRRLKKQPAKPPARGRVYFVDVRETNGVQHYIYRSDVGFEELVGWRNRKGHVVKGYVEPDGPAKVVVGRLCDRTLPVGTPCFRDTGIPMSTDSLPGFEPWLLEDGTHLFPSHPGAITELRSFDDKTVFLVMDAGSVTPAEGCPEIPVDKFLDIVHRETFPEEYKRLDSLGHRLLRQTREALLGAIKPSYDAAKEIAHRAVQSLLVIKPWHLGTWMKYAKYAFTSADAESPGQVLWGGMDLGAEQISARMRTITRFANAYGSMRSVCAGVKRMPDIKRHGPERVKLALTFINERRPLDKPAVTEDDLFGTLEWRAREARRIVAEWHGPLPEESDTLVDAFLEHAGIGAAPGHPTTNLTASRLRLALKRGLQRHKERLKPSSDIHSTTAINSFQVDGNSIKYHFDWQDFEVEINCVVPGHTRGFSLAPRVSHGDSAGARPGLLLPRQKDATRHLQGRGPGRTQLHQCLHGAERGQGVLRRQGRRPIEGDVAEAGKGGNDKQPDLDQARPHSPGNQVSRASPQFPWRQSHPQDTAAPRRRRSGVGAGGAGR